MLRTSSAHTQGIACILRCVATRLPGRDRALKKRVTERPDGTPAIVLPEFVPAHWWDGVLHNQAALRLKAALLFRPGTVVTSVPYHPRRS